MSDDPPSRTTFHGTTIVAARRDGRVAVAGDGQVSLQTTVLKQSARKVRRLAAGTVIVGFAGATADAMALSEKLEEKLKEYNNNLARAAVELAKQWRTDRYLRHLEALMIAASEDRLLLISGNGDVFEPDDNVLAIGSGGPCAQAAAMALFRHTDLDAESIAREALTVAASIDIYTNDRIVVEAMDCVDGDGDAVSG